MLVDANYVAKCFAMAADGWVSWNGMTQRLEFFYMRKHKIDIFEKSWKEEIYRNLTFKDRGEKAAAERFLGGGLAVTDITTPSLALVNTPSAATCSAAKDSADDQGAIDTSRVDKADKKEAHEKNMDGKEKNRKKERGAGTDIRTTIRPKRKQRKTNRNHG